ncbi:MAG: site-specific integrase [Phycisphaeraceae bacterium]|nr:site-specific integrase [Phycisphaeraceae bacterium]
MASVSRDKNGLVRILFTDRDGERRSVRLGRVNLRVARVYRDNIEDLNTARITNTSIAPELAEWVAGLSATMHGRLERVGLVDPRIAAAAVTLGALLERFEDAAMVKAGTKAAYRQATGSLRDHFGEARALATITPTDADAWRKAMAEANLAPKGEPERRLSAATVAKRVHIAKAIFRRAIKWGLLKASPFAELRAGSQANPDRTVYVPRESIARVLEACPDDQWRAIIALVRFAGLRCPSEVSLLRWGDVNWERGRLTVRSPKTAGHDGHAVRMVPIAPELRPILDRLFHDAPDGAEWVVPRLRDTGTNLRTTFEKIIERAGLVAWPRLFHNLRASCAMDWCERFPGHVVASWLGHSPLVAARHYMATRDHHFELAVGNGEGGAQSDARVAQNEAQHDSADDRTDSPRTPEVLANADLARQAANTCDSLQKEEVGAAGFEPAKA